MNIAAQSEPRIMSLAATSGSISRPSTPLRSGSKSHGQPQSYEISPYKCGTKAHCATCLPPVPFVQCIWGQSAHSTDALHGFQSGSLASIVSEPGRLLLVALS